MDFFQHQEKAKQNTFRLITLFFLAVVGIVVVVYILFAWLNAFAVKGNEFTQQDLWNPVLFIWVAFFTLLVIGLGTLFKTMQLKSGGGAYVAESLGGRMIQPGSQDPDEQKVLNVVEEIAIAAGIPAPSVYLLDQEDGINAFAAGYKPSEAVIGVTRGCIEQLNRDELQGVIAHEFSHIFNGDMRLNIRLIGLLFGILALGLMGYYTLRSAAFARGGSRQQSGGAVAIVVLGIGLMAVGFIGTFFGHLIKAGVSRQREFLADASAVQFTRNPDGIGNALKKIRDYAYGSVVKSPHAAEASHMFFSKGILSGMAGLFATHPPLEERIRRIFSLKKKQESKKEVPKGPKVSQAPAGAAMMAGMGQPNLEQIQHAKKLVEQLPPLIRGALRDSFGARAVVYGLLLSQDPEIQKKQLDELSGHAYVGVYRELKRMLPEIEQIEMTSRIPLIDMAMPAFKMLSKNEYRVFRNNIKWLIRADNKVDLFEWVLEKILVQHLDSLFLGAKKREENAKIKDHLKSCQLILSTVSKVGNMDPEMAEKALKASLKKLGVNLKIQPLEQVKYSQLDQAIDHMATLASQEKKKFLEACLICMEYDKKITVYEAELFRAIGDAIGCPVPLVLPSVV